MNTPSDCTNQDNLSSVSGSFRVSSDEHQVLSSKKTDQSISQTRPLVRLLTATVFDLIQFFVSPVAEVNRIIAKQDGKICHIWIFVDAFSEDVLDRICDQEERIIDEFSHCHFDFKVIYQPASQRNHIILGSARELYIREE